MPSISQHLQAASRNQQLLSELIAGQKHSEWIATVAFYKAVHLVEALFFHQDGSHSQSHDGRMNKLKSHVLSKSIFEQFKDLKNVSQIARYLHSDGPNYQSFEKYMPIEVVCKLLVGHKLKRVEDVIVQHLPAGQCQSLLRVTLDGSDRK